MQIDFEKLPRFKPQSMMILTLIGQWSHAFGVPEDAIIDQIYTAHAWASSNPKKAPKKNMTRFLWSWMRQAKSYGNLVVPKSKTPKRIEPDIVEDMTFEEMQEIRRRNFPQANKC